MRVTYHTSHVTCYKWLLLLIACCLLPIGCLFSQQKNLPLNREWSLSTAQEWCYPLKGYFSHQGEGPDSSTIITDSFMLETRVPSCFKPYLVSMDPTVKDSTRSWLYRKLKQENLIIIYDSSDKFLLTIDPLFNFEYGKDYADSARSFYKNTRGILVRGDIGSKFSFESSFYENQATFVDYIKDFNDAYLVVPGQGRWKKFKANGYDFAMASGYVSYSPSRHFNFQVGHGKHFVGDGYRSLLLSDNAFNYPYARITSTFGKFQYTNLYASLMNLTDGGVTIPPGTERLFQKKAANFQLLSWNVHKRIQLGFFQGLIWQASDSLNRQCLKLAYASPVIYTAALSEGLGGNNNVLLGWSLKLKLSNSISLYGQYALDDNGSVYFFKNGWQAGLKYFDILKIKNLHFQAEWNGTTAYTYTAINPSQNYSHYNQALAHPLGTNFNEICAFVNYRIGDVFTQLKFNYANTGYDQWGLNYGNNIFLSDTINIPSGLGGVRTLRIIDFHIGYLINPSTNLNIIAGWSLRNETLPFYYLSTSQTNFIYFGIRTSLSNVYYDF